MTSVSWTQRGAHLAVLTLRLVLMCAQLMQKFCHDLQVGTNKGEVQIWDSTQCRKMRTMLGPENVSMLHSCMCVVVVFAFLVRPTVATHARSGHLGRVGTMAWNGFVLLIPE